MHSLRQREWERLFSKVNAEEEGTCVRGCSAHGEGSSLGPCQPLGPQADPGKDLCWK